MNKLRLVFSIGVLACFISSTAVSAQTQHVILNGKALNAFIICDKVVDGYFTYQFTYHLDKDGRIDRIHWKLKNSSLTDVHTGEKYKMHDVGNDNALYYLDFFNNINYENKDYGITYDVEDGWLDDYLPDQYPQEGIFVGMNFKIIGKGKGVIGVLKMIVDVSFDSNGEMIQDFVRFEYSCK